jgi:hypothetical protein
VADEAARIMQEHGLKDFRGAKEKAALRLGVQDHGALPSNEEIEKALTQRNRIFHGEAHVAFMDEMRRAAIDLMEQLEQFQPRLIGALLNGSATAHSTIELHFFSDTAEAVGAGLDALGLSHRATERRLRTRRDQMEGFPGLRFHDGEFDFDVTVFPERMRGHAPLSPVDGKPMRRAGVREIEALLAPRR